MTGNCPVCGTALPAHAPHGLCPKCLLRGVAAPTETGGPAEHRTPPSLSAVQAAFPQLEILEFIGQGGMGAVYKARQPKLNRLVALKLLPEALGCQPTFAERFAREGQTLARLHHPNIVTVHDFGQAHGFFYLLMEYVDGVNLRQAMQAGRFSPAEALSIVPMICDALQYAHDEGVLHRDIKPENILLDTKGRVRLVDFGIAKLITEADPTPSGPRAGQPYDSALTQSGSALGTPDYMAPEQRSSPSTVDERADIFALGVVFYEMLTGELPIGRFAPPSRKTPVDARVDEVVLRAMAQRREQRFRSAAEVRTRVEAITADRATQQPVFDLPPAAHGHPTPLSRAFRHLVFTELWVLTCLMLHQILPPLRPLGERLWSVLFTGWTAGLATIVGTVLTGWLGYHVWRCRRWLLAPFLVHGLWPRAGNSARRTDWTADRGLVTAWIATLGVLGLEILWMLLSYLVMFTEGLAQSPSLAAAFRLLALFGTTLLPTLLSVGVAVVLVCRELRRSCLVPPAPPPAWTPGAIALALAFAVVTHLPIADGDASMVSVSSGGFMAVVALALAVRSRIWRALAVAVLVALVTVGVSGAVGLALWSAMDLLPLHWSERVGPFSTLTLALGMQGLSLLCYGAALLALLRPQSAAAFGIPPRSAPLPVPTPKPPGSPPIPGPVTP